MIYPYRESPIKWVVLLLVLLIGGVGIAYGASELTGNKFQLVEYEDSLNQLTQDKQQLESRLLAEQQRNQTLSSQLKTVHAEKGQLELLVQGQVKTIADLRQNRTPLPLIAEQRGKTPLMTPIYKAGLLEVGNFQELPFWAIGLLAIGLGSLAGIYSASRYFVHHRSSLNERVHSLEKSLFAKGQSIEVLKQSYRSAIWKEAQRALQAEKERDLLRKNVQTNSN